MGKEDAGTFAFEAGEGPGCLQMCQPRILFVRQSNCVGQRGFGECLKPGEKAVALGG